VVTPEHRYYGKSSPFESLTTENLRFLSSKQALFDLAAFRQHYQVRIQIYEMHEKSPYSRVNRTVYGQIHVKFPCVSNGDKLFST
jgi:hypothetical protein